MTTNVDTTRAATDVVGVWRLVEARARTADGQVRPVPYGPRGMGLVSLTADGRMMAVLVDGRKEPPPGGKREYSSYCGNYTFDGRTLVTVVDASSDATRFGVPQVRQVRFEGERMVLTPPDVESNGVKVRRELTWERIGSMSL